MYGSKNKYVLSQVNWQWTEKKIYSVWTRRDSMFFFFLKVIKYILWFGAKESWLKTQHFYLSRYQYNTGESPTSHPRINKGDLWQGRERKKRGKETSDPSPARKYRDSRLRAELSFDLSKDNSLLRWFPLPSPKRGGGADQPLPTQSRSSKLCIEIKIFILQRLQSSTLLQELVIQKITIPRNTDSWC